MTICQQRCCDFPRQYVYGHLINLNSTATSIDELKVNLEKAHQLEQSKEQQSLSINLPVAQCYSYLPWYSQQVWTMSESGDTLSALNSQHENLLYNPKLFLCLSILSWYLYINILWRDVHSKESEQMHSLADIQTDWLSAASLWRYNLHNELVVLQHDYIFPASLQCKSKLKAVMQ